MARPGTRPVIFSPAVYNLAETTRCIQIARACRDRALPGFKALFVSYGGEFESLIAEAGFDIANLEPQLTPEKIDHLYRVDQGQAVGYLFTEQEIEEQVQNELQLYRDTNPWAVVTGFNFSCSVSCRVAGVPLVWLTHSTWDISVLLDADILQWTDTMDCWFCRCLPTGCYKGAVRSLFKMYGLLARPYSRVARRLGVHGFSGMEDLWRGDFNLLAEPEGFCDAQFPPTYHFIGPLIAKLDAPIPDKVVRLLGREYVEQRMHLDSSSDGKELEELRRSCSAVSGTPRASSWKEGPSMEKPGSEASATADAPCVVSGGRLQLASATGPGGTMSEGHAGQLAGEAAQHQSCPPDGMSTPPVQSQERDSASNATKPTGTQQSLRRRQSSDTSISTLDGGGPRELPDCMEHEVSLNPITQEATIPPGATAEQHPPAASANAPAAEPEQRRVARDLDRELSGSGYDADDDGGADQGSGIRPKPLLPEPDIIEHSDIDIQVRSLQKNQWRLGSRRRASLRNKPASQSNRHGASNHARGHFSPVSGATRRGHTHRHGSRRGRRRERVPAGLGEESSPVVYFAMGSSGQPDTLAEMITALGFSRFRVIAPVKRLLDKLRFVLPIPDNVVVTDWLPAHLVNPLATISVIHGGIGTVMTACLSGTPVIGVAMQPEQEANIDALVHKGFAVRIPKKRFTSVQLIDALNAIAKDKEAFRNAQRYRRVVLDWEERGPDLICSFFSQYIIGSSHSTGSLAAVDSDEGAAVAAGHGADVGVPASDIAAAATPPPVASAEASCLAGQSAAAATGPGDTHV